MPYPVDIPPTITGYSVGINGSRGHHGFEYTGAFYAFLDRDGTGGGPALGDFKIHALKSTDQGLTWSELDSANAPTACPDSGTIFSGTNDTYTVARDGSTVWVLVVRLDAGDGHILGIAATSFDLTTGAWGSSTNYSSPLPDFMGTFGGGGKQLALSMAICGPGNYQVMMSGARQTIAGIKYGRCAIASFDGSTMGAAVELPGQSGNSHHFAPVSALGDGGRAHFFYLSNESNPIGFPLYHVGLDIDGTTFGATQQITTSLYNAANNIGACSEAILFAGQLGIAAQINDDAGSTTQSIRVFYGATALDPTWSEETATTGVDGTDPTLPYLDTSFWIPAALTLEYANGSMVLAWTVNGFGWVPLPNAFWSTQSPYPGFAWATPALLFQPSIVDNQAVQVISFSATAGVGIIGMGFDEPTLSQTLAQFFLVPIGSALVVRNRVYLPGVIAAL